MESESEKRVPTLALLEELIIENSKTEAKEKSDLEEYVQRKRRMSASKEAEDPTLEDFLLEKDKTAAQKRLEQYVERKKRMDASKSLERNFSSPGRLHEDKLAASEEAGFTDAEVLIMKKDKFTLKRRARFIDEDGVLHEDESVDVVQIAPKPANIPGKKFYRNDHKAIRPHAIHRTARWSTTHFSADEIAENLIYLQNKKFRRLDIESLTDYRDSFKERIDQITIKSQEDLIVSISYFVERVEFINSILPEEENQELEVTVSEPNSIMDNMRGWLRGRAQELIELLEKV